MEEFLVKRIHLLEQEVTLLKDEYKQHIELLLSQLIEQNKRPEARISSVIRACCKFCEYKNVNSNVIEIARCLLDDSDKGDIILSHYLSARQYHMKALASKNSSVTSSRISNKVLEPEITIVSSEIVSEPLQNGAVITEPREKRVTFNNLVHERMI